MATKTTAARRTGAAARPGAARGTGRASRPRRAASAAPASSLVYVYCLVQSDAAPRSARAHGVPGAGPARAVPIGGSRWLVVADVPRSRFEAGTLTSQLQDLDWLGACAVAHDAVVMELMKAGPVVPMRLLTIFESEVRAIAEARRAAAQISSTLRRVAGRAEYGVRVSAAARRDRPARTGSAPTGRSFLEQKREQLAARRRPVTIPAEARARVFERLAALAAAAHERPIPVDGARVWLDGAFLVPLTRAAAFRREVQRLSRELHAEGHELVLTGPWPPYSFLEGDGAASA